MSSTDRLTHYAAHRSRGREALNAIGIAPKFGGTSVHDGLVSYQGYSFTQALCNVHHLRELTFVEEELKQSWARKMKDLLLDMKAEVERAKAEGKQEVDVLVLARLLRGYDELLARSAIWPIPPHLFPRSEREGGPNKALLAICWIDSLRGSGMCSGSCTILLCLLTTTRRREICA